LVIYPKITLTLADTPLYCVVFCRYAALLSRLASVMC
jgi:hypothetical protein